MATSRSSWYWHLGLVSFIAIGGVSTTSGDCALAQITPDVTLGAESSVVTPDVIRGLPSDRIDGGAIRGANLFHSFQEFNIGEGRGAYFTNPDAIGNILSRVTGNDPSNILGKLGVLGNANLFLINPNGIIFGPSSSLDINGSFVGSTASSLKFADGTQFSTTAPKTPLLTVSVPIGLQYGGTTLGGISNKSQTTDNSGQIVGLQVQPGRTLALVGGNVGVDGGRVQAPGGRVELGGVAGAATVGLSVDGNNLRLSFPDGVARSDVSLTNKAEVDVAAGGGGSIAVNAQNLDVSGESLLYTGIAPGMGSAGSQAGDITLNATGEIKVTSSDIVNQVGKQSVGNGGDLNIFARSVFLTNGSRLLARTYGRGNAGIVTITAQDTVSFDGEKRRVDRFEMGNEQLIKSILSATVESGAVGNGGNVNITTGSLSLTSGTIVFAGTFGQGDAGSVTINARDTVYFGGRGSEGYTSGIASLVGQESKGEGGNINITTGSLSGTKGGLLSASTFGQGNAGSVTINARDSVSFDGEERNGAEILQSGILSLVGPQGKGNGGSVNITTSSLSLTDGARLIVSTNSQGNGGSVTINARDTASFDGERSDGLAAGVFSGPFGAAVGNGGDINITTRFLSLTNGAQLNVSTFAQGDAGDLAIFAPTASIDGANSKGQPSGVFSNVEQGGTGKGGDINFTARSIILDNQGEISAETTSGKGGNINLQIADLLLLRHDSQISTSAGTEGAGGDGGNITINTDNLVGLENSDITANAFTGRGGTVNITTKGIFGIQPRQRPTPLTADITAISETGLPQLNGIVEISNSYVNPEHGLVELPAELADASDQIASGRCPAGGENKFIITGRGGLPPNPREPLSGEAVLTNWAALEGQRSREQGAGSREQGAGEAGEASTISSSPLAPPAPEIAPHHPITPSPHHPLSPTPQRQFAQVGEKVGATGSSPLPTPLDAKTLQSLRQMAGARATEVLDQIIDNFLADTPELLQAMRAAAATGNALTLQQAAHKLRSASANLGAKHLSQLCKGLETMGSTGNTTGAMGDVLQVEAAYETVKAALQIERRREMGRGGVGSRE